MSNESDFDPYYKWLGIPPHQQPPTHYRLLSLETFESDRDVIQAAAERQMAHLQNYKIGPQSELSQKLLSEVARAKVCLLTPMSKAAYDQELRSRLETQSPAAPDGPIPQSAASPPVVFSADPSPSIANENQRDRFGPVVEHPLLSPTPTRQRRISSRPQRRDQFALFLLGFVGLGIIVIAAYIFFNAPITEPTQPTIVKPTQPAIAKPTQPTIPKPTQPTIVKPTQPTIAKPTQPTITKPTVAPPGMLEGNSLDAAPHHVADMPQHRGKSVPATPARPGRPAEFKLELPTGRVFTHSVFDIGSAVLSQNLTANRENQVLIRHPNGALYAAASQLRGQLNGVTIGQYENKELMVYITYLTGKRHGIMKTWSEAGKAVLFEQYVHGKRNGFACWHEDGTLRLLLQYTNDEIVWAQLMSDDTPLEGFKTRESAEKNDTAKELFAKLDQFETDIKKNEQFFRKQVKDFEVQRRKSLAAQLGPEKRRMALDRENTRRAAEDQFLRGLHRMANGR